MTQTICYTCNEEIPPDSKRYVGTFYGHPKDVCFDCAVGIHNGNEILQKLGVSGEWMGKCPDNEEVKP